MAIEKEKFFEIINEVGASESLDEDNLLERIKNELKGTDAGEYNKFSKNFSKEHQFSIKISEEAVEDWTLLHLATACKNLLIVELLLKKKASVSARVKDGSKNDGLTALHIAAYCGHKDIVRRLLNDNRVDPSLKSKNKTPREVVGNTENKEAIVKMLEEAEKDYSQKVSIKNIVGKFESPQRRSATCNGNLTPTGESVSSDDSGLELETTFDTSSCSEINHEGTVDNQILENLPSQIQLRDSRIRKLERSDKELKQIEKELDKAEKELEELKSYVAGHKTKLKEFNKENQSLKQKIKNLENENTTLNSELSKTKANKVSLEKTEKRQQCFLKVASANLVTMLAVGVIFSIAFQLPVLLMIAISVISALVAGGVTYATTKLTTELTELKKEVAIQQHSVCKT